MTQVKVVNGKLVVNKTATTEKKGRLVRYFYPPSQYDTLLKLSKTCGLETGSKVKDHNAVRSITKALIDDFITNQSKPKTEPKAEK